MLHQNLSVLLPYFLWLKCLLASGQDEWSCSLWYASSRGSHSKVGISSTIEI